MDPLGSQSSQGSLRLPGAPQGGPWSSPGLPKVPQGSPELPGLPGVPWGSPGRSLEFPRAPQEVYFFMLRSILNFLNLKMLLKN